MSYILSPEITPVPEIEVANFLNIPVASLINARRTHQISYLKLGKNICYLPEHIKEYLKNKEVKKCEANQRLSSSQTEKGKSNLLTGISSISTENAVNAALRGAELARKTMRLKSHSPASFSNASDRSPESQMSL